MKATKAACLAVAVAILVLGTVACGSSATGNAVTSTAPTAADPAAEVIVFNDPVLEKGIRAALNKSTGDITIAEAATLKELDLDIEWQSPEEMMIKDITVLEHFVSLEILELQFHAIRDIRAYPGRNPEAPIEYSDRPAI